MNNNVSITYNSSVRWYFVTFGLSVLFLVYVVYCMMFSAWVSCFSVLDAKSEIVESFEELSNVGTSHSMSYLISNAERLKDRCQDLNVVLQVFYGVRHLHIDVDVQSFDSNKWNVYQRYLLHPKTGERICFLVSANGALTCYNVLDCLDQLWKLNKKLYVHVGRVTGDANIVDLDLTMVVGMLNDYSRKKHTNDEEQRIVVLKLIRDGDEATATHVRWIKGFALDNEVFSKSDGDDE